MKTKTRIFLLLFSFTMLNLVVTGFSQNQLYTVVVGDTAILNMVGTSGTIQWQQSEDSLSWVDISGATANPQTIVITVSSTGKCFFRAKIFDSAICQNSNWYSSTIRYKVLTSTTQVAIGDWFRGGIVFYTDGSGQGLIAPQQDQSTAAWGCVGTSIPGATSLTDGNSNTTAIYNNCSDRPIAASICYDYVLDGYDDWYLPAINQLSYLWQKRLIVGGFNNFYNYLSSTENDANNMWFLDFNDGSQNIGGKDLTGSLFVRSIRSFSPSDILAHSNSTAFNTKQPLPVSLLLQPQSQNKCLNDIDSFYVSTTGTSPILFQWKLNGINITNATDSIYTIANSVLTNEGIYTCEVTNLCRTITSNNAELKVIDISANAGLDKRICNGQGTQLQAAGSTNHITESGTLNYEWFPSTNLSNTNIANPIATPIINSVYTVNVTDQLGCSDTSHVEVIVGNVFQNEEICLVTVDTSTWKNKIMWEKTPDVGTIGYSIFKEVGTNIYSGIGYVPYTDPSEYIDNSSNPESYSSRYKIAVIDTCGNESAKSFYHKSINLTIATFGSTMGLNWNDYIDESGVYVPTNYYIYRGDTASNMQLIDSVPGGTNSYNDNNVYVTYYYMVGVKKINGCNIGTKANSSISFSNKKQNSVGINDNYYNYISDIYPNPFSESTTITTPNISLSSNIELSIIDVTGKVIRTIKYSEKPLNNQIRIERGNLTPGVYLVELIADRTYRGKLIVE